jgi:hypothetical protein
VKRILNVIKMHGTKIKKKLIKFRFPGKVGIFYRPSYGRPSITTHSSTVLPHVADEGDGL